MRVLFYASKEDETIDDLQQFVCSLYPEETSRVCGSCEELIRLFQLPGQTPEIAVLYAADIKELNKLISYGHLFANTRLVIILPDQRLATVAKALSINPRFITYTDGRVEDTKAVLDKMLARNPQEQHERPAAIG